MRINIVNTDVKLNKYDTFVYNLSKIFSVPIIANGKAIPFNAIQLMCFPLMKLIEYVGISKGVNVHVTSKMFDRCHCNI